MLKFGYNVGQGLRSIRRGSPTLIEISDNKGRLWGGLGYKPTHEEHFQSSRGKKRKCASLEVSIPHIKAIVSALAEVIILEPFNELEDKEFDLACIIQICPEEFFIDTIISSEDDSTSTIRPGMLGKTTGLGTIKP